ncbi:hypothetical protein Desti_0994 [Desulfomonile tiedjei DSM 6799]|uniref:Uncharacterized protein n=1 Tax=Desulfomonile tiedjei (strain ATCC 49306 / DSM 6799 / DCB-1) TaxID=706587 RepID=I4C2C1_DESTA|nr:hypothetical protein Desti_0994 [Desulfomonile tiedjei DSM 6799]
MKLARNEEPEKVGACLGSKSKQTSDLTEIIEPYATTVNSFSASGTCNDSTGCDFVCICEIIQQLHVPAKIMWDTVRYDKFIAYSLRKTRPCPEHMRDCPDYWNLYGCRYWRWPDVIEWWEGQRNA